MRRRVSAAVTVRRSAAARSLTRCCVVRPRARRLWALWEGYKALWEATGWTWPFLVNDTTMPHLHDDRRRTLRADRRPVTTCSLVHCSSQPHSSRRRRRRSASRSAPSIGFVLGVVLAARSRPASGRHAVRRRVADDPDPRARADRRRRARERLDRRVAAARLDARRGHRRVPDVLPGHGQHGARACRSADPAARRADAARTRRASGRSSGSCASRRRCRTSSPRSRSRRPRASSARSSASCRPRSRTASAARS